MAGGSGWEEMKVDRPGRLVLRCHTFQDNILVDYGKSNGVGVMSGEDVLVWLYVRGYVYPKTWLRHLNAHVIRNRRAYGNRMMRVARERVRWCDIWLLIYSCSLYVG